MINKNFKKGFDFMDRFSKTRLAGILGIIGNIFLLIIKGIVGFISGSQSMIADAFNSARRYFCKFNDFYW